MSEMIKRVARAIGLVESGDPDLPEHQEFYRDAARAAIEAMREPTRDMITAANRNNRPRDEETWRTMIDAALGGVSV